MVGRDASPLTARVTHNASSPTAMTARHKRRGSPAGLLHSSLRPGFGRFVGLVLLGVVVFMWTGSSFLASSILADHSYNKPFIVTYVNSAMFMIVLPPIFGYKFLKHPDELRQLRSQLRRRFLSRRSRSTDHNPSTSRSSSHRRASLPEAERLLSQNQHSDDLDEPTVSAHQRHPYPNTTPLTIAQTARISLEFCSIWFLANYFLTACLEYTTVASSTILTSTSSIFTLAIGSWMGVEIFTFRKAVGVLASFAGVALIGSLDASGRDSDDKHRGSFPLKSRNELVLGDALALASAVLYGVYSVSLKRRIGDAARVDMPLFFGFVGLFIVSLAWPGMVLLHVTGVEPFVLPPTTRVTSVLILNALTSLVSDLAWALAVLLTSPIVVSVGLSLTIPLSLLGQLVLHHQISGPLYWLGAAVVVASFIFINNEEKRDEEAAAAKAAVIAAESAQDDERLEQS